jgi:glutamate--cysteine ligase
MSSGSTRPLNRDVLLDYFLQAATPRDQWQVGMELEKLGRNAETGDPLPYEGDGVSVTGVLEFIRAQRGGDPILEADKTIGIDAPWGTISLEPGGQVEWSSRPAVSLGDLSDALQAHLSLMRRIERELGVRWLNVGVDPDLPLDRMPWMPKARYKIMRPFLGARGRLAHRMMTQTASIQCAFDYSGPEDWKRKFVTAAKLTPVAVALFANSSRIDGKETGYASYRQAIWRETDPERCGLPAAVFDPAFDLRVWLDWVLQVPTMFLHRARGRVPAGGIPFASLLERAGCTAVRQADWETHISTVFTDVRSYSYIEVRSADLQPDPLTFSVPAFWTGILYHDDSLDAAAQLVGQVATYEAWLEAMESASRLGLDGNIDGRPIEEIATEALSIALNGLTHGAACTGPADAGVRAVERLAEHRRLEPAV